MAVTVRIPAPLRNLVGGSDMVEASGSSVSEVLEDVERRYPGFAERLRDENGELRRFVNIFVNEEDARFLQGPATPVSDGDEVSIIPAIAGGCPNVRFAGKPVEPGLHMS